MHLRGAARPALTASLAATALLGGCQREPPPRSVAPPAAASTDAPATPARVVAPGAARQDAPPAGVLRAYVFKCEDGQTLKMRNLLREGAIAIDLPEGTRRLSQSLSASGAKYEDGAVVFWDKGREATFERKGTPAVHCTEVRSQSLLEDARLRGVAYFGTGNEPGWTIELGPGNAIAWVTGYGQERHEFQAAVASGDAATGLVYAAANAAGSIKVTVRREPCHDDMSGESFEYRVAVESGGRSYRGCASRTPR